MSARDAGERALSVPVYLVAGEPAWAADPTLVGLVHALGRAGDRVVVIQVVAIAVVVYVPRLGAATTTTGMLWELQAITAVVIGGTALRGGVGRIWGTICGAFMLEIVGNIMVLSNIVSEYLIGAVQGTIIIIAMLVQRTLQKKK